jgi:hypothetical protein
VRIGISESLREEGAGREKREKGRMGGGGRTYLGVEGEEGTEEGADETDCAR